MKGIGVIGTMKELAQTANIEVESAGDAHFAVDTTFVLFFLAVEFGQIAGRFGLETFVIAITLMMLVVLPYFLPAGDKIDFGAWVVGRTFIAGFGMVAGALFKLSLGPVLPETFRFMPLTLLIITALFSCYLQFYGLLRLGTAK